MKLIRPFTVTPAALTDSNVPEAEATWSAATTYGLGAEVRGVSGDPSRTVYISQQAGNLNHNPATDTGEWWLAAGATNRWRMFDAAVSSQTSNPESVEVTIQTAGRVDSVALLNINAASATVTMTDATDGVVFNETFSLVSSSGIIDWYGYFFEPVERMQDLFVGGMPAYANAVITVTLEAPGGTASVGALVVGLSKTIGETQAGGSVGIVDYSRKERDAFGNSRIVERPFSKRGSFVVWVPSGQVDQLQILLAAYRAVPIVYVGSEKYGSTILFGIYRDFSIEITYPTRSLCSITIEGLT